MFFKLISEYIFVEFCSFFEILFWSNKKFEVHRSEWVEGWRDGFLEFFLVLEFILMLLYLVQVFFLVFLKVLSQVQLIQFSLYFHLDVSPVRRVTSKTGAFHHQLNLLTQFNQVLFRLIQHVLNLLLDFILINAHVI